MSIKLHSLTGKGLRSVRYDDETVTWCFDFGDGYVLQVASPWRFIRGGAIVLGHRDHGQKFGLPAPVNAEEYSAELVGDRVVVEAMVADGTADLKIDFGRDLRFEVFNNSSGYEGWILNTPDKIAYVAKGGGKFVEWKDRNV